MSQGCALLILRSKGQRSRSWRMVIWKWFPDDNWLCNQPMIMKLHTLTPHEFVGVGGGPVLLQQYFQYAFICCPYMLPLLFQCVFTDFQCVITLLHALSVAVFIFLKVYNISEDYFNGKIWQFQRFNCWRTKVFNEKAPKWRCQISNVWRGQWVSAHCCPYFCDLKQLGKRTVIVWPLRECSNFNVLGGSGEALGKYYLLVSGNSFPNLLSYLRTIVLAGSCIAMK